MEINRKWYNINCVINKLKNVVNENKEKNIYIKYMNGKAFCDFQSVV